MDARAQNYTFYLLSNVMLVEVAGKWTANAHTQLNITYRLLIRVLHVKWVVFSLVPRSYSEFAMLHAEKRSLVPRPSRLHVIILCVIIWVAFEKYFSNATQIITRKIITCKREGLGTRLDKRATLKTGNRAWGHD